MITSEQKQQLGELYRALREEVEVSPGDGWYVPIWENTPYDPVNQLLTHITWSEVESLQLFSGFSGAGKSTQLRRLKQELQDEGYFVIYANAEDYISLGEAVDITDLLLVIAGAFSDGLKENGVDIVGESYWTRFVNYLMRTNIQIDEVGAEFDVAKLKASLKTSPSFRQKLQQHLKDRLPDLRKEVESFVEFGVKAVKGKTVVLLFDSLEKLRGTPSNADEIMNSLEQLFRNHLKLLQLPFVHCVYSVPAWLRYMRPDAEMVVIPSIRQWHNDDQRTCDEDGWRVLRDVIRVRFKAAGCELLFGPADPATGRHPLAEQLLEVCGGSLRDLMRLLGAAMRSARALPVDGEAIGQAIGQVRNSFKTNVADAHWLKKVAAERAADPPTASKADLHRLMRLLDTHLILYFRNGSDWYDIHPLIRDEVDRIVRLNPQPTPPANA